MAKNKWVSFFLCLFFGYFGIHKFYEGRILLGIVYLLMLRAQASLTQAQLADEIGIPRTTYSAIENKKRKMTFSTFVSLSKYFLQNKKTADIMKLLGLSEEVLSQFFYIEHLIGEIPKKAEIKKVAAFGGNRDNEVDTEKQRKIEKAIKGIDK